MEYEKKLEMLLKRAHKRGHANNSAFEANCSAEETLENGEGCVVRIDTTTGAKYHFTNRGILYQIKDRTNRIANYSEIEKHLPSAEGEAKRPENWDSVTIYSGTNTSTLEKLGNSWTFVVKFLRSIA